MRRFIPSVSPVLLAFCLGFLGPGTAATGGAGVESGADGQNGRPSTVHEAAEDRGIGPVERVKLGAIDEKLVSAGKEIFRNRCSVCHDLYQKKAGPPLGDVTKERTPEFIMNLILNTSTMENKDPIARKLVSQYGIRMPDPGLDREQARMLLEYLRSTAKKN